MKAGMEVNINDMGKAALTSFGVPLQAMSAPIKFPKTNEIRVAVVSNPIVQGKLREIIESTDAGKEDKEYP